MSGLAASLVAASRVDPEDPITTVEVRRVALPLRVAHRAAHGTEAVREVLIVRVVGADGAEGWGECPTLASPGYGAMDTAGAWRAITGELAPAMLAARPVRGASMAVAALADACADRVLRRRGEALADVLGVAGAAVPTTAVLGLDDSVEALVERAGAALEGGAAMVKVKVRPGWSTEPVSGVATATGVVPAADANGSFDVGDEELAELARLGPAYLEQPCPAIGIAPPALGVPLALDEELDGPDGVPLAAGWLADGADRLVNLKPSRVGGVAAAVELVERWVDAPGHTFVGGMLESGVGRSSALAVAALVRSLDPVAPPTDLGPSARYVDEDLTEPVVTDASGALVVPSGPGLGPVPDPQRLAAHTVERRRLDG